VPLVGDVSVRDYNNAGTTNTINNISTVQAWDNGMGQRLDREEFVLPAAFATQTLNSVTITDTGKEGDNTYGSRAVLAALTVSTCRAYLAEGIKINSGPIVYYPSLKVYAQGVSLMNTLPTAVDGPLFLIVEGLPAGVTLVNRSEQTECLASAGSRYVVPLPAGSSLAPNTSAVFALYFSDPSGAAITYTPLTAASLGGRP
jgi:hypothetical protein